MKDMNKIHLPKESDKKMLSRKFRNALSVKVLECIEALKKELGYKSQGFEIDSVLLDIVSRRHESYINEYTKQNSSSRIKNS